MNRTLNLGSGKDAWGTDKIDLIVKRDGILNINLNLLKRLPYPNNTFTSIRAFGILEFAAEPHHVLGECHRVLKRRGEIHIETPNAQSVRFTLRPLGGHIDRNWYQHLKFYTLYNQHTLRNALEFAGFEVLTESLFVSAFVFKDKIRAIGVKK